MFVFFRRVSIGDSSRVEWGATSGHAELRINSTASESGRSDVTGGHRHRQPPPPLAHQSANHRSVHLHNRTIHNHCACEHRLILESRVVHREKLFKMTNFNGVNSTSKCFKLCGSKIVASTDSVDLILVNIY